MQMPMGSSESLGEVVNALRAALGPKLVAVVLFGSRARGDADETSDWDLLVVAHDLPMKVFRRHLWLKGLLPENWRARVAILAKTPEEFEQTLPGLYLDIALDGIVLHDTDGFIAERLARLRRLVEVRGLRRERIQHDLTWRWEQFPGFGWSLEWEAA